MKLTKLILLNLCLLTSANLWADALSGFTWGPKAIMGTGLNTSSFSTYTADENSAFTQNQYDTSFGINWGVGVSMGFHLGNNFYLEGGTYYTRRNHFWESTIPFIDPETGFSTQINVETSYVLPNIELPFLAFYKLPLRKGFWKFGGGMILRLGLGDIKIVNKSSAFGTSDSESFTSSYSDQDVRRLTSALATNVGFVYQLGKNVALNTDFKISYELFDRLKSTSASAAVIDELRNISFDLETGILF